MSFRVHLVDGTYELFRAYYGGPSVASPDGGEVGATRTFMRTLWRLLHAEGATHVACAFDHTVESFRNELFDGYKTGDGIDPDLFAQFPLVEEGARALGVVVWPMVEFEADDALSTGAHLYSKSKSVEQVLLCTPDKDLMQCVRGEKIVCLDRRREKLYDAPAVVEKFGVPPRSIPDWLALVGDTADGIPGIPRWGAKSASAVLAHYGNLERIPADVESWGVRVRGAVALSENLNAQRDDAALYKVLATMRTDVPLVEKPRDLRWRGPDASALGEFCEKIGDLGFLRRLG